MCVCNNVVCERVVCERAGEADPHERRTHGGRECATEKQELHTMMWGKAATREFYPIQTHQNVLDVSKCHGS